MTSSTDVFPIQPCIVLVPDTLYPIIGRPTDDQIEAMVLLSAERIAFLVVELDCGPVEMLVKVDPVENDKRRFEGLIANGSKFVNVKGAFTEAPRGTFQLVN